MTIAYRKKQGLTGLTTLSRNVDGLSWPAMAAVDRAVCPRFFLWRVYG
jgi:hypothetical protein